MLRASLPALLLFSVFFTPLSESWAQGENFGGDIPPEETRCETPDVLMLLDRSGSMLDDMKWEQATTAIQEVFSPQFETLRFGLLPFPSEGSCLVSEDALAFDIGQTAGIDLPQIFPELLPVDIALTPLAGAITTGQSILDQVRQPNRRSYLILLTDGIETCVPENIENSAPVEAVRTAANDGVNTYIIGFGSRVRRSVLRSMAMAGGTERERLVEDQSQLEDTLNEIIESAIIERCDRLDNDCDGRIDEGLGCDQDCDPAVDECPCNNDLECRQTDQCVEGFCAPRPCNVICDVNFVCIEDECIPADSMGGEGAGGAAPSQEDFGGTTPLPGGTTTPAMDAMPNQPQASSCMGSTPPLTYHLLLLVLCTLVVGQRRRTE